MRSEAASRRRRYSTTLGQGASLRSAPTLWPRKLSGETGPEATAGSAATAGAASDRSDKKVRLNVKTYGRGQRDIGSPPSVTPECTVPGCSSYNLLFRAWQAACFCYNP